MSAMNSEVRSADGTAIGYEAVGSGPPLVVVHGSSADRTQWEPLKAPLAEHFTVYLYDRRGRGASDAEAGPYSLTAEAQDLLAVLEEIGEPAFVFGHSYGGLVTLKAAVLDPSRFRSLLIDETPAGLPGPPQMEPETAEGMKAALDSGGRDGALEFFLRNVVGLDDAQVENVRGSEMWENRKGIVHTMPREAQESATYVREADALAALTIPVRFVIGSDSTGPMREAIDAVHADMPQSELVVVDGRLFTTMYSDAPAAARQIVDFNLGHSED